MINRENRKKVFIQKTAWPIILSVFYLSLVLLCACFAPLLPIGFSPSQLDLQHIYQSPLQWQLIEPHTPFHWLGTDNLGRDVLANLIYGCRTALLISVPAMGIATIIGIFLGGMAGYYGDKALKISLLSIIIIGGACLFAYFYGVYIRQFTLEKAFSKGQGLIQLIYSSLIILAFLLSGMVVSRILKKFIQGRVFIYLPIDLLIVKCIELLTSIPRILIILCLAAYTKPSLFNLILVTGFTYWTEPARLVRGELLRIKKLNYIESARALGLADMYILIKHALPNALSSIIVASTYSIAGLISLESTLSFLNIGVPADIASWGKMVASIKSNFWAWWLVVFPGMALCATVLSLQTVSGWIIQKLNPYSR